MGKKDSIAFDTRFWHNVQPPEEMDVSRRFEYDEDAVALLRKWLGLNEGFSGKIIEVGCGSGYFTGLLTRMAPSCKIVAIEPDDVLREYAERKFDQNVKFLKGKAEEIPLPSNFSDLSVCHIVLCNLPDIPQAVKEMTRITKKGGKVCAIEPCGGVSQYFPDTKLTEILKKAGNAFGKGIWDLRTKHMDYSEDLENKQARYPEVFSSCGLTRIEAHGLLSVVLLSDFRRDSGEIHQWIRDRLASYEKNQERLSVILERGGLEKRLIEEYHQSWKRYIRNLARNPKQISKTHELQAVGRIVTIGTKP
jgi:ubiquinone/menaquinone biosynthesis C-methylase UbiE